MLRQFSGLGIFAFLILALFFYDFFPDLGRLDSGVGGSFVTWTLLGLAVVSFAVWAVVSLNDLRLWIQKRSAQFGVSLIITTLAVVALLSIVNVLSVSYNKKWDVTQNQLHTLSDQTKKIAGNLKEGITLRIWTTNLQRMATNLDLHKFFENYAIASHGKIKVEIKNPNEDRLSSTQDNVKRDNLIIVRSASGREIRVENFTEAKGEEQVTNAIVQAIKGQKKTVCFLGGHGESGLDISEPEGLSVVRDRLKDSAYDPKEIELNAQTVMPPDCEALVIVGPRNEGTESEREVIRTYLKGGGKVLALLGPAVPTGWKKLVAEFGVQIRQDLIMQPGRNSPVMVITNNYSQDLDITKSFKTPTLFIEASSIQVPTSGTDGVSTIKTFVSSFPQTYAKAGDLRTIKNATPTAADLRGPFPIAVVVTRAAEEPGAKAKPANPPPSVLGLPPQLLTPGAPKAPGHSQRKVSPGSSKSWWAAVPTLIPSAQAQANPPPPPGRPHGVNSPGRGGMPAGHPAFHGAPPPPGLLGGTPPAPAKPADHQTLLIVVSNNTFAMNGVVSQIGNMDLFLNTVSYMLKDQDLMGIRPRELRQASLELTRTRKAVARWVILGVAIAFLVGGVLVPKRRRRAAV